MRFNKHIATMLSITLLPHFALSQVIEYSNDRETFRRFKPEATSAVVYTRDTITILVKEAATPNDDPALEEPSEKVESEIVDQEDGDQLPEAPQETGNSENQAPSEKTAAFQRIEYDVTIRREQTKPTEGFFQNSPIIGDNALLLVYDQIEKRALRNEPIYEPMDFLFVGSNGKVIQAIPNLIQANLNTPIVSEHAVKALLYLPAGHALTYNILPGSVVEHPLFNADPVIIK